MLRTPFREALPRLKLMPTTGGEILTPNQLLTDSEPEFLTVRPSCAPSSPEERAGSARRSRRGWSRRAGTSSPRARSHGDISDVEAARARRRDGGGRARRARPARPRRVRWVHAEAGRRGRPRRTGTPRFGATAKGGFFVTQAAAPHLRESGGVVIMIEDVMRPRAVAVVRPSQRSEGRALDADKGVRARARARGPRVRDRARAGGGRARTGGAAGRRVTARDASARPTTSPTRWCISQAPASSPGSTLVVDGGRLLQSARSIPT